MDLKAKKALISKNLLASISADMKTGGKGGVKSGERLSIKRASVNYQKGSSDAQELQIENERLQTSVMILSQKLKMKEDDGSEELEKVQSEMNTWKQKYKNSKTDNDELEDEIDKLQKQLKSSGG